MKNKIVFSALIVALGITFKWLFAEADADRLDWLLRPASALVSLCTGIPFSRFPGEGYGNEVESILIAPACSGLNFFIILSVTGLCLAVWHLHGLRRTLAWGITGLCAAYAVSLTVNTLRIVLAIGMYKGSGPALPLSAEQLHRVEGVIIYYVCLCFFVMLFSAVLNKIQAGTGPVIQAQPRPYGVPVDLQNAGREQRARPPLRISSALKVLLPLFCYLLFTLGIPLLNGATAKAPEAFALHCLTVLLLSAGLSSLAYLLYRKWDRTDCKDTS